MFRSRSRSPFTCDWRCTVGNIAPGCALHNVPKPVDTVEVLLSAMALVDSMEAAAGSREAAWHQLLNGLVAMQAPSEVVNMIAEHVDVDFDADHAAWLHRERERRACEQAGYAGCYPGHCD